MVIYVRVSPNAQNYVCRSCFVDLSPVKRQSTLFFQALDLTVQLMELGEKALIQSDPKYAYGDRGRWEISYSTSNAANW